MSINTFINILLVQLKVEVIVMLILDQNRNEKLPGLSEEMFTREGSVWSPWKSRTFLETILPLVHFFLQFHAMYVNVCGCTYFLTSK